MQSSIISAPTPGCATGRTLSDALAGLARKFAADRAIVASTLAGVPESRPCPDHPDREQPLDREKMLANVRLGVSAAPSYGLCPVCAQDRVRQKRIAAWTRRGVPARLAEAALENYDENASEYAAASKQIVRAYIASASSRLGDNNSTLIQGGFLLLAGPQGTGKSHLAAAALRALRPHVSTVCEDVRYLTHADLVLGLRTTYGGKKAGGTAEYIEELRDAPALVVDEFGLSSGGADEAPAIQTILAARHDARRPTIIVSNETLPALHRALGYRVADRIAESCHVAVLLGESYRRR